jgi:CheY-like chemotaxis protein
MSTILVPITPKVRLPKSRMTPAQVAGGRKRILLVDADLGSQTRRAGMLRQRGVEVMCATDMAHAQQLWHAESYNLVIMDATNVYDGAMAFCKSIKLERPEQLITFLVGQPEFLSPSPLQDTVAQDRPSASVRNAHTLLASASDKFSRGTGIMNCTSQISTRRALHRLRSADRAIDKQRQEVSFGEAVRHAAGK